MRNYSVHDLPEHEGKTYRVSAMGTLYGEVPDDTVGMGNIKYACNFRVGCGTMIRASGVEYASVDGEDLPSTATMGSGIAQAIMYNKYNYSGNVSDYRFFIRLLNGKICEARPGQSLTPITQLNNLTLGDTEMINFTVNGTDVVLLFDSTGKIYTYNGSTVTEHTAPGLTGISVYQDRIYGIVKNQRYKLRWSASLDPYEWENAGQGVGSLVFPDEGGPLRRTLVCGSSLYVFSDFSVYRMYVYKDTGYHSLQKIFTSHKPIYEKTAAVNGEKIYFMADDGFYEIKGSTVTSIWKEEFCLLEDRTYASAAIYGEKYYVTAKFHTDGGEVGDEAHCYRNNGIVGIDLNIPDSVDLIRGVDIADFLPCRVGGKAYMFLIAGPGGVRSAYLSMLSEGGKIYGEYPEMRYKSPCISMGYKGRDKIVRRINICLASDAKLTVRLDKDYEYEITGSVKIQSIPINKRGQTIQIGLSSFAPHFTISGFEIEYELVDRREYGRN